MNDYKKEFSALQSWVKRHHQKQSLGLKAEVKESEKPKVPNVNLEVKKIGWVVFRLEKAVSEARGVSNTFYGVKVLWFKVWFCMV